MTASGTVANGHGAARWYPREVRVHGADSPNLWVTPECDVTKVGGSGQSDVTVTVDGEDTEVDTGGAALGSGEHLRITRDGRVFLVDSGGGEERVGTCLLPMLSPDFSVSATSSAGSLVVDVDYDVEDARGGFHVGRTHSLYDMGALIASRKTGVPARKAVTKTVPHMSGFYDFSALYGAVAFESREQAYSIDVIGDDRADAQERRSELLTWLSTIHDADIWDDDVVGWHLHGSFSGAEWEESEDGEGGTLTATFLCQPLLVADAETSETLATGEHVIRNGGQTTQLTASATSGTASVSVSGSVTQAVSTTPVRLAAQLVPGDNEVNVAGGTVRLAWHETRL